MAETKAKKRKAQWKSIKKILKSKKQKNLEAKII